MSMEGLWGEQAPLFEPSYTFLDRVVNARSVADLLTAEQRRELYGGPSLRAKGAVLVSVSAASVIGPAVSDMIGGGAQVAYAQETDTGNEIVRPELPRLVVIADSLGEGTEANNGEQEIEARGVDVTIYDALKGRQYILPACEDGDCPILWGEPAIDGKRALQQHQAAIEKADGVAILLGTNGFTDTVRDWTVQAGKQVYEISNRDGKPATAIFTEVFGSSTYVDAEARNTQIRLGVQDLQAAGIPAAIIPMKQVVDSEIKPAGGMAGDDIHLDFAPNGYPLLAMRQAEAIAPIVTDQYLKNYPIPEPEQKPVVPPPTVTPVTESPPAATTVKYVDLDLATDSTLEAITPDTVVVQQRPFVDLDLSVLPTTNLSPELPADSPAALEATTQKYADVDFSVRTIVSVEDNTTTTVPRTEAADPASTAQPELPVVDSAKKADVPVMEPLAVLTDPVDISPSIDTPDDPEVEPQPQSIAEEEVRKKAAELGILYDENGRAVQYIGDFIDRSQLPVLEFTEGWGDTRTINGRTWSQGNADSSTRPSSDQAPIHANSIAGLTGRIIETYTSGEGNKVGIIAGIDAATGQPNILFSTHLEDEYVVSGQFVRKGELIGISGDTGTAIGVHNSTGLERSAGELGFSEYANKAESVNIFNHFDPAMQYQCRPSAMDDQGEYCGPSGPVSPLPVDLQTLDHFGLPEYIHDTSDDVVVPEPQPVSPQPSAPKFVDVDMAPKREDLEEDADLPIADQGRKETVPELPIINPVIDEEADEVDAGEEPIEQPSEQPADLEPPQQPTNPDLPVVDDTKKDGTAGESPGRGDGQEGNHEEESSEGSIDIDIPDEFLQPDEQPAADDENEEDRQEEPVPAEPQPEPKPQPEPEPVTPPPSTPDPNDATLGHVPKEIYDTLTGEGFGYSHAGAIGWMANFALESGLNPTRTQIAWDGNCAPYPERLNPGKRGAPEGTRGMGFGLGQWTLGDRQEELQKASDRAGVHWTDLQLQLAHARNEADYFGINEELRTTEDIAGATVLVLARFENPQAYIDGGASRQNVIDERVDKAVQLHDMISRGDFASIDVACD